MLDQSPTVVTSPKAEIQIGDTNSDQSAGEKETLGTLRDAVVDLYLAIKVRSEEELDAITDEKLEIEKKKLEKTSAKMIVDYIRTSIEIIMNLKVEDLEKEFQNRNLFENFDKESFVSHSVASNNLIQ